MSTSRKVAAIASAGLVPAYEWWRNGQGPLTAEQLGKVYPRVAMVAGAAGAYLRPLNAALRAGGITTPLRMAAFLAQVGQESGELRYFEERASGAAYEGRHDLGNTQAGDGVRYKGRGPIQLTGRANYAAAGAALGLPLEQRPELAAEPKTGFLVATWYWNSRNLNQLADMGTLEAFRAITQRINGGQNGAEARERYWHTARAALGA